MNYYDDEEEVITNDRGIYPDLIDYIDLFTRVKEITVESDNSRTCLVVKLDNGQWSFCVFYDVTDNPCREENHNKLMNSFSYYLEQM